MPQDAGNTFAGGNENFRPHPLRGEARSSWLASARPRSVPCRKPREIMMGAGRGAISRPCLTTRIPFPCRDGLSSVQGWLLRARWFRVPQVCAEIASFFGRFVWWSSVSTPYACRSASTTHLPEQGSPLLPHRCASGELGEPEVPGSLLQPWHQCLRARRFRRRRSVPHPLAALRQPTAPRPVSAHHWPWRQDASVRLSLASRR
jgi:hypothetical protein